MTTDTRTAAELADLVRAGNTDISPADIAAARAREEFAGLQAEAASRAELAALKAARQRDIDQLRADVDAVTNDGPAIAELATAATKALNALAGSLQGRRTHIDDLVRRARALGIPEATGELAAVHDSGIGWRAAAGRESALVVDDRHIVGRHALDLIDRIVRDVVTQHRLHDRTWKPTSAPSVQEQIASLDTTITRPEPVSVRLARRWGQHQPGTAVATDPDTAAWLKRTGIAAT